MGRNGDPEPDDYGLPPVDIAIPDDARELDRDVIAYRREQRQERLRRRLRRLTEPFARYGIATPFVAGALLIALISATLMTVFASRPSRPLARPSSTVPGIDGSPSVRQPPGRPRPGQVNAPLPDGEVSVSGRGGGVRRLRDLHSAVIALIPAGCRCDGAIEDLVDQTGRHGVDAYLVTAGRPYKRLRSLAEDDAVRAAEDTGDVLFSAYRPRGLTALLVHSDGVVGDVRPNVRPSALPGRQLEGLRQPA